MAEVTIRDLRNHGGEVVDRVAAGERVTITRAGKPVAELRPIGRAPLSGTAVFERWAHLPRVDADDLRADLDRLINPSL
jgi:prevent-host-death family protein